MASPMYQVIAQDLRKRIESGELLPGDQLPTELELRARYGAARNTVRDADRLGVPMFPADRDEFRISSGQVPAGQSAPAEG